VTRFAVSTALALDAAANLVDGPPPAASRPLGAGAMSACRGVAFDVVRIAFPEAVTGFALSVSEPASAGCRARTS
jgi:hypothetical protein